MKKVACLLGISLAISCVAAHGVQIHVDDLDWWGNSEGTEEPVGDSERAGHWWWPTDPQKEDKDEQVWGNRGVVYSRWQKPEEPEQPAATRAAKIDIIGETPGPGNYSAQKRAVEIVLDDTGGEAFRIGDAVHSMPHFDLDSATLRDSDKAVLDQVAAKLKENPEGVEVLVEGHCCDLGTDEYNLALGVRRAEAVRDYLISRDVDAGLIEIKSLGKAEPLEANTSEEAREANRRAKVLKLWK